MSKPIKFFDWSIAPNPRRLRLFIQAKGIEIDTEDVGPGMDELTREPLYSAEYTAKNPRATTPALELDDGTIIGDAAACMRYLEEVQPEPPLFGSNAKERALVDMWEHRAYEDCLMAIAESFRNSDGSPFEYAYPGVTATRKIPELVERGKLRALHFYEQLDAQLAKNEYVAGDFFSAADITALCAYDFGLAFGVLDAVPGDNIARWYLSVSTDKRIAPAEPVAATAEEGVPSEAEPEAEPEAEAEGEAELRRGSTLVGTTTAGNMGDDEDMTDD
jgi:glutathione S-transferase